MNYPALISGAQWGDEGKGKIVDVLARDADFVVRFNGGNNAGHTVVLDGKKYPLSLLPSGVLWQKKLFLSQGVAVTPEILIREIDFFKREGLKVDLSIDYRTNVVMPYHKALDEATELAKGDKKVGSLKLGIGYCYEDRNNRHGIRMTDLTEPEVLREKLDVIYPSVKKRLKGVFNYDFKISLKQIFEEYKIWGKRLKPYICDVSEIIARNIKSQKILFEGAHGTFLDANFGTYPFTTAVNTISGSVFPYVGIPPQKLNVLGIVKAYTTRVGGGPFPTELFDENGGYIREKGGEFGTVSQRPRRCGWLDLVMLKYAHRLNGFTELAVTKLDVLSGLKTLKIATHYTVVGKRTDQYPQSLGQLQKCRPIFKTFAGWEENLDNIRTYQDLLKNSKIYLSFIEDNLKVPVKYISIGAERKAVLKV